MPTISAFYGLTVTMHFNEHLPPHVHILHDGKSAVVLIETGEIYIGALKPQAARMAREWVLLHKQELMELWTTQEFRTIKPLE